MAGYFQPFWASSMPKRLIRYTLSKLDIFETDALDLDKIDIAWGMGGHLKWQDVGVKIEKLEKLLQLPPSLEIQKAKVLALHLTVPAAIHSSPIQVEADGVEIKLRIVPQEEQQEKLARKGTAKRKGSRECPSSPRDDAVPHAIDLAQSFLETQSRRETEELQAALEAETQDLAVSVAASVTSSEDSEDDVGFGTGQPLSLPTFLADFLQGMVDRLQFAIKHVTCHLDIEVPVDANSTTTEKVTFQLAIDEINAEGVTATLGDGDSGPAATLIHKEGKRYVQLDKIRASLISEASVFAALSVSSSVPSSAAANSPVSKDSQPSSEETSTPEAVSPLGLRCADSPDRGSSPRHPMVDSEDAFNIPYDLGNASNGHDDSDPQDDDTRSTPSTPRAPTFRPTQSFPRPETANYSARSTYTSQNNFWVNPREPSVNSVPTLGKIGVWGAASNESVNSDEDVASSSDDDESYSDTQNLAQSRIFSHEEAESMYMSAFSHASSSQVQETMPGGWGAGFSMATSPRLGSALDDGAHDFVSEGPAAKDNLHEAAHNNIHGLHGTDGNTSSVSQSRETCGNEQTAEGATTPKGPTKLAKELVSLDTLQLWFPSKLSSAPGSATEPASGKRKSQGLGHSVTGFAPGPFSIHSNMTQSSVFFTSPAPGDSESEKEDDFDVEVALSPLEIKFDLSTAFLLTTVIMRILGALKESSHQATPDTKSSPSQSSPISLPSIKVIAKQISIHLLETLNGVAYIPEHLLGVRPATFDIEPLLTASLQELSVKVVSSQPSAITTSINVGKFNFGYSNDDIVSFDQRIQMRASVRDAFPSPGSDISMTIVQSADANRCEIKTLPLHLKLDLPRLDETFTWFTGLSGFLNLASSTSTNSSQTFRNPAKAPQKTRSVRFETPIPSDDVSPSSENKVNMRVGGFRLDLLGKECRVALDTTAVKLINRDEGIGIGITKIQLKGPYLKRSLGDPPVKAVIKNTRIEFLTAPKDHDLERLLELIIPSKNKFDTNDDEIMVDTLLRQRRKGSVLRINVDDVDINVTRIQQLQVLTTLGDDFASLSTVTKYLPEDDRPGLLTLAHVRKTDVSVHVDPRIGILHTSLNDLEVGHITLPSLLALGLGGIDVQRNYTERLICSTLPSGPGDHGPVLTMRMVGDEMEPVIKLRMQYLDIEYRVPTLMDFLGLDEDTTPQEFETSLAASVANLGDHAHTTITGKTHATASEQNQGKPTKLDLVIHDCLIGLNPHGLKSKMFFVLTDSRVEVALSKEDEAKVLAHLNKASVLLIDDVSVLKSEGSQATARRQSFSTTTPQVVELCQQGFAGICYLSSAKVEVGVGVSAKTGNKWVDVEARDGFLVLETCADSTQTLIALANALAPPTPPKREIKYKTNVIPVADLLASISADAFGTAEGGFNFDEDFLAHGLGGQDDDNMGGLEGSEDLGRLPVESHFFEGSAAQANLANSVYSDKTTTVDTTDGVLLTSFSSKPLDIDDDNDLVIDENFYSAQPATTSTAHRWNSSKNVYDRSDNKVQESPFSMRVRKVHFIWNLFDGYDWDHTRDVISKAVSNIETAIERRNGQDRARAGTDMEADDETVIDDFLFNSIYIGIPTNRDPRELAQAINQELNDNATETESIATTSTATTTRPGGAHHKKNKKLRLSRSKRYKITFELEGINVDLLTFPPGSGETQSSIVVRITDLVVFDHIPTSTWKKFATYDQDKGERETDASMVHLEILNVKPLPELSASEIVLKAKILPLRLHVDQDALDFITRFFEFKDESVPTHASPSDIPFIQRAEVYSIPVNLDFKPKRVNYAGLRSGHTTEFMNFVVLDQARLVLKHIILYGIRGFDRLGLTLNDVWTPEVKRNQLPTVLAGLAPVRPLVNVGSGFKELIEVPIREYRKDGRIVRSIGKGTVAFVKTTGTELVKLGAKIAVGTQTVLQGAEGLLTQKPEYSAWQGDDGESDEETEQISLYANQPTGVIQGLRGAYASLSRDLHLARDAIIAVPGEVMESENAQGAAKAVLRRAPTIVFRPLIGSSKAIGQTLMGATNSLDPENRRRIEEKYKRH